MASRVLTIAIGNEYIKICEVSYSSQKVVHLYGAATIPTPPDTVDDGVITDVFMLGKVIKEATDTHNMNSKNVIYTLQSGRIASKDVLAPFMKSARIISYITANATDYFPVNIEEYVLSYSVLEELTEEDGKKLRLMVAAAPLALVEPYYELSSLLGYHIEAIDYLGNSNLQIMRLQFDETPSIVIQMGEDSTMVTILNKNVLQIMRSVPYGRGTAIHAYMDKYQTDYDKAEEELTTNPVLKNSFSERDTVTESLKYLSNNISRVMDYYTTKNPDYPIERAYLITEGIPFVGAELLFTNELNISVEKTETITHVFAAPELNMTLSNLTLYLGNLGAVLKPVNFIPVTELNKVRKEANGKYFRLGFLLAVFVSLLLIVIPFTSYLGKKGDKSDLEADIQGIASAQSIVDSYYDAKDRLQDVQGFQALTTNPNDTIMDFIKYLEHNMPSDISITNFSSTSGSITMSCIGSSKESLAAFVQVLKANTSVTGVYVAAISESADSSGAVTVSYSLTCGFNQTGKSQSAPNESQSVTETTKGEGK